MPFPHCGRDVAEERAAQRAGVVAREPEMALEGFEVGDLDVLGHEVLDVGEQCRWRLAVLGWEGFAVGDEGWVVP